jgi:hypothetical protein
MRLKIFVCSMRDEDFKEARKGIFVKRFDNVNFIIDPSLPNTRSSLVAA